MKKSILYERCVWSLPMIYLSTYTRMTSREICFLCLRERSVVKGNVRFPIFARERN